ncbi:hypothetical protein M406DRAFT_352094 [Cryphonectria parasitica EP155]|uniref:Uncharacterized protein n=1 Tax=Cryphonectria parasitica (strain ATCC 38755 / EP155) TaxID=660469 RepID=A0A9P5CPM8_CRYP1|nr:uncharacterized protein M406DRAFT_352094 [Cryphonectria parasitica EP155]KAF3765155.1 hypothetical protein M406DRAFT_352094 [Cryphonectria parasitica EP155]
MDAMLTDLEAAEESLQREQALLVQKDAEINRLKQQLDFHTASLSLHTTNQPNAELDQLQARLQDLETNLQDADRQDHEQAAEMHALKARLQKTLAQLKHLEKEYTALLEQQAPAQLGLQAEIELEMQKQVDELQYLVDFYKQNWEEASYQIKDARDRQEELRQSIIVKNQQLRNQEAQIQGLKLQLGIPI